MDERCYKITIKTVTLSSMSIPMFLKSQAFLLALDPLRQISVDLDKAKDFLAVIQEVVLA